MTPDDAPPFELPDDYANMRLIARDEINQALIRHLSLCPLAGEDMSKRLRQLETKFATLIGLMIGSGIIGGTVAAALAKLLP